MAILIPSKNIYDKQNPKVRDNVIERIEVGAVEVVPDNEYETPVYNSKINLDGNLIFEENITKEQFIQRSGYDDTTVWRNFAYVWFDNQAEYKEETITIPKINNNKLISKIVKLKDENEQEQNIQYSLHGKKISQAASASVTVNEDGKYTCSDISYGKQKSEEGIIEIPALPITIEASYLNAAASVTGVSNSTNLNIGIEEDENNYYISYKILVHLFEDYVKGAVGEVPESGSSFPHNFAVAGNKVEYKATSLEITIYGNTIGIDLTDKTVYINGETQKKVHSVDGNELMQTSNYFDQNGTKVNAIDKMYRETQSEYAIGKETATIRCSIGDYYDYDNGEKVISIDDSTGKMSFKMYDQVIPMVYGADGEDHPMSTYQDGSAKIFQVLGSKIYYDGAVWQELSLQEV